MSVLIKGMEMPTSGGEYELLLYVDSDGTATVEGSYCRFEGEPFEAVPVPQHGRLIDADALVRDNGIKEIPEFYEVVRDAPTIIPAEEGE